MPQARSILPQCPSPPRFVRHDSRPGGALPRDDDGSQGLYPPCFVRHDNRPGGSLPRDDVVSVFGGPLIGGAVRHPPCNGATHRASAPRRTPCRGSIGLGGLPRTARRRTWSRPLCISPASQFLACFPMSHVARAFVPPRRPGAGGRPVQRTALLRGARGYGVLSIRGGGVRPVTSARAGDGTPTPGAPTWQPTAFPVPREAAAALHASRRANANAPPMPSSPHTPRAADTPCGCREGRAQRWCVPPHTGAVCGSRRCRSHDRPSPSIRQYMPTKRLRLLHFESHPR